MESGTSITASTWSTYVEIVSNIQPQIPYLSYSNMATEAKGIKTKRTYDTGQTTANSGTCFTKAGRLHVISTATFHVRIKWFIILLVYSWHRQEFQASQSCNDSSLHSTTRKDSMYVENWQISLKSQRMLSYFFLRRSCDSTPQIPGQSGDVDTDRLCILLCIRNRFFPFALGI